MAYMTQEKKKELAPAIKSVLKKYKMKGTIGVSNRSTLVINIKSGPIKFSEDRDYLQVNHFWIERNFEGDACNFLKELKSAAMTGNHDNSDSMTDHFDVGWYLNINVGKYNKPYELTS